MILCFLGYIHASHLHNFLQVQAGMWRRNGYSLINQLYFYQNVRCRTEMYDRDIVLLQLCAALMGSSSFILAALHRFNLLQWAREDYDQQQQLLLQQQPNTKKGLSEEDTLRQTLCIAEEFLRMMIILTLERFTPGIGQVLIALLKHDYEYSWKLETNVTRLRLRRTQYCHSRMN